MEPASSQSWEQIPGVVTFRVVVLGVVLVVLDDVELAASELDSIAAASFAACNNFSTDIGLGDAVDQPANSVVALLMQKENQNEKSNTYMLMISLTFR